MTMTELTNFLGWCTLLNFGMLIFATIALVASRPTVAKIHSRLMDMESKELSAAYFNYLANYKLMIFVFNLSPYLALRIMGA